MSVIIHQQRARVRADLVGRLRELAPKIRQEQERLEDLIAAYNAVLRHVRLLQDVILDDLEDAQDRGEGPGAIDLAHYFWTRADFADYVLPDVCLFDDAERLAILPGDV